MKRMFTAAERSAIERQQVAVPTGTIVEIGGFEFNLVPLTSDQMDRIFALVEVVAGVQGGSMSANAVGVEVIAQLIAREGKNVRTLVRDVLFESAKAVGMIDFDGEGEAVFDEWFGRIDLLAAVRELVPAVIKANGLTSVFGANPSNPAPASAATRRRVKATPSSTSSTSA